MYSCQGISLIDLYSETCVPYTAFKNAGFDVKFATEAGKSPECDSKMLEGLTQRFLVRSLSDQLARRACSNLNQSITGCNLFQRKKISRHGRLGRMEESLVLV